jgi:hypothetical protein
MARLYGLKLTFKIATLPAGRLERVLDGVWGYVRGRIRIMPGEITLNAPTISVA